MDEYDRLRLGGEFELRSEAAETSAVDGWLPLMQIDVEGARRALGEDMPLEVYEALDRLDQPVPPLDPTTLPVFRRSYAHLVYEQRREDWALVFEAFCQQRALVRYSPEHVFSHQMQLEMRPEELAHEIIQYADAVPEARDAFADQKIALLLYELATVVGAFMDPRTGIVRYADLQLQQELYLPSVFGKVSQVFFELDLQLHSGEHRHTRFVKADHFIVVLVKALQALETRRIRDLCNFDDHISARSNSCEIDQAVIAQLVSSIRAVGPSRYWRAVHGERSERTPGPPPNLPGRGKVL